MAFAISMVMRMIFTLFAFLLALPAAEAAGFDVGTRVMVKGRFKRKCAARVESVPAPGFVRLSFDRPGCGDASQPFEHRQLQRLSFVEEKKLPQGVLLRAGADVVVPGFRSRLCHGKVREISRTGYVAVDFDALLCADTEALRKASELQPVEFVPEFRQEKTRFKVGQHVKAPGIFEKESCGGVIRKITSNGFALIDFQELTCAEGGRLFSLEHLKVSVAPGKRRKVSGESIFQSVMRQIASDKNKKSAKRRHF